MKNNTGKKQFKKLSESQQHKLNMLSKSIDELANDIYSVGEVNKCRNNSRFVKDSRNILLQLIQTHEILMNGKEYKDIPHVDYRQYYTIKKEIENKNGKVNYVNKAYLLPDGLEFVRLLIKKRKS